MPDKQDVCLNNVPFIDIWDAPAIAWSGPGRGNGPPAG
jgi:hypothetical protein